MKEAIKIEASKTFRSTTTALSGVRDFVNRHAVEFGFEDREVSEIVLAVDEACTNVIKHAYKGNPDAEFVVRILASGSEFQIIVRDWGNSFRPDDVPIPNIRDRSRKHRAGGLGIHLMRKLMDAVEYQGRDEANEVRLTRYLRNEPKP